MTSADVNGDDAGRGHRPWVALRSRSVVPHDTRESDVHPIGDPRCMHRLLRYTGSGAVSALDADA